jgi:hypothetical protein
MNKSSSNNRTATSLLMRLIAFGHPEATQTLNMRADA